MRLRRDLNILVVYIIIKMEVTPEQIQKLLARAKKQNEINLRSYHKHKEEISERRKQKRRELNPSPRPRGRPRKVQPSGEGVAAEGGSSKPI